MENKINDLLLIDQLRKSIVILKNFLKNFSVAELKNVHSK